MLGTLAILLLLTGCTSFQVKEAGRSIAVGLFEEILDGATDGIPYEVSAHSQYIKDVAKREEDARQKQEREKRHYEEEANSILDALDQAESTITDYERRDEEGPSRRDETFKNKAEFDRFMRELETAEERNNDPRFGVSPITGSF